MGIPININDILYARRVESTRIEYKASFNPDAIIRTICAFANDIDNTGGGYIVIGVEEENGIPKLPIKGIEKESIDGILKKMLEYCYHISPLYNPVVEPFPIGEGDRYVIVIWVPGGHDRPYKAPKNVTKHDSNRYFFIRKYSSTVIASTEEEKALFYISSYIPFDDRECLIAEVDDLDLGLMRDYLRTVGSDLYKYSLSADKVDIARDMHLISGPSEYLKPLNVGILMFSEKINEYFKYARIEVVDIPDPTGTNMVEKTFLGPIQRQLKDALAYLRNYVIKEVVIKYSDKEEATRIFNYPYSAIEEILANAVLHRSYQIKEPITVRIERNQIEITSTPGFDRSITDENIKEYNIRAQVYRNRRIGEFLKELDLTEGRNTGFPNAYKALRENGSDLPIFHMDEDRTFLSVIIPIHSYFAEKKTQATKDEVFVNQIVAILKENTLTITELSKALGYKTISKKLRTSLDELVENNTLDKVIDNRSIKYKYHRW